MLVVKKFGGTSVGNAERIQNVANRIAKEYRSGNDVVVVLSAMGKMTDVLIDQAKELNPNPPKPHYCRFERETAQYCLPQWIFLRSHRYW